MVEGREHIHKNESSGAPIRIFGTNPNNPEQGRIFLWTKAGWFERIREQSGDLTYVPVAQSEDELRKSIVQDDPAVDLVQLGREYRKRLYEEFTGQSTSSNVELFYAIEREKKNRLLTITGITLIVLGLIIFGGGIFFRLTYSQVNFEGSVYKLEFLQAYSAGLSAILVGSIMDIFGWIIIGLTTVGKR